MAVPLTSISLLKVLGEDAKSPRWTEFANKYASTIEGFLFKYFPTVDAEEVVQETLIALVEKLPLYEYDPDTRGHFRNYLIGIVRYKAIEQLKRRNREAEMKETLETKEQLNWEYEKQAQNISFSNPGIFRVNKKVAVRGGTSDARNSHIFNIFALVDIGERSGMGLADLYGHWKKYSFPEPVIAEEFDPDRVKITVCTGSNQESAQADPTLGKTHTEIGPRLGRNKPNESQKHPESSQDKTKIVPSELNEELASVRQIYRAIVANPRATYRGLSAQLDFSKDTIGRAIARLIRLKIIRREGNKQTGYWEILKR